MFDANQSHSTKTLMMPHDASNQHIVNMKH